MSIIDDRKANERIMSSIKLLSSEELIKIIDDMVELFSERTGLDIDVVKFRMTDRLINLISRDYAGESLAMLQLEAYTNKKLKEF